MTLRPRWTAGYAELGARAIVIAERDSVSARAARFLAHARRRQQEALAVVTPEMEAVANTNDVFARFLAEGYAMAGVAERAIHWLTVAVERGYINYPFLAHHDPCFESMREQPGFRRLMETVRERWQRFET